MDKICYYTRCQEKIAFVCNCFSITTRACETHIGNHLLQEGDHSSVKTTELYLNATSRSQLYQSTIKATTYFQTLKRLVQKSADELIKKINTESCKMILKIQNVQKRFLSVFKEALCGNSVDKKELLYTTEVVIPSKCSVFVEDICNSIQKSYDFKSYISYSSLGKSDHIVFCSDASEIKIVCLSSYKHNCLKFDRVSFGPYSMIARVDDDRWFYHGGKNSDEKGTGIDKTYILNLKTKEVEVLPSSSKAGLFGGVIKGQHVYKFGGCSDLKTKTAKCYKLNFIKKINGKL